MIAGAGAAWLVDAARESRWLRLGAGGAAIAVSLIWLAPLSNENAVRGATFGFGFVPRKELSEISMALRRATSERAEVIAPAFISFEANRMMLVRFPENYGVVREAEEKYRTLGFETARATMGHRNFFDLITETSHYWNDRIVEGVSASGSIDAVIIDSPIQLLPLVNASDEALLQRHFHVAARTEHYTLWVREKG
jgi:hypothetical protein